MGISLNLSFAFKPRRKPTQKQLDDLAATACYADVGIRDDGYVYADLSDCNGEAVDEFVKRHAANYVVLSGDCDDGAFEEIVCPPHVVQWKAEVHWRRQRIMKLIDEIVEITRKGGV